jgi:AcrR family transcriptional regulator
LTSTEQRINQAAVRLFVQKGATQLTVSELAAEANVARGTLYRNVGSMDDLFDRVVADFSADLHRRVSDSFDGIDDPAARLATGVRMWIRYGHDNPELGRFIVKFGLAEGALRSVMVGPTMSDVMNGIDAGRYVITRADGESVAALIMGSTISAMWLVLEGHQTWRDAGSATAELLLRALGIAVGDARDIARRELPQLRPS